MFLPLIEVYDINTHSINYYLNEIALVISFVDKELGSSTEALKNYYNLI